MLLSVEQIWQTTIWQKELETMSFSKKGRHHWLGLRWHRNYNESPVLCSQDDKKKKKKKKKEYVWRRVVVCEPCKCYYLSITWPSTLLYVSRGWVWRAFQWLTIAPDSKLYSLNALLLIKHWCSAFTWQIGAVVVVCRFCWFVLSRSWSISQY